MVLFPRPVWPGRPSLETQAQLHRRSALGRLTDDHGIELEAAFELLVLNLAGDGVETL
jgi:hypothetical protein